MRTIVIVAAVVGALATSAMAQDYGDGFGVGGVLLPSGSTVLVGKTRIGDEMGLEIELAFSSYDNDDTSSTDIAAGAGLLWYMSTGNEVQPYFGGRAGIVHSSFDAGPGFGEHDDTSFTVGAVLGAEYFVNRRLSLEGEAGVRIVFGSLGLDTGTRLAAFLYL